MTDPRPFNFYSLNNINILIGYIAIIAVTISFYYIISIHYHQQSGFLSIDISLSLSYHPPSQEVSTNV